jgi:hypothetical protein
VPILDLRALSLWETIRRRFQPRQPRRHGPYRHRRRPVRHRAAPHPQRRRLVQGLAQPRHPRLYRSDRVPARPAGEPPDVLATHEAAAPTAEGYRIIWIPLWERSLLSREVYREFDYIAKIYTLTMFRTERSASDSEAVEARCTSTALSAPWPRSG